jgi:hypothetical protein
MKNAERVGLKAAQLITNQITELGDWRGRMLARLRKVILEADPTSLRNGSGIPRCGRTKGLFAAPVLSSII